MNTNIKKNKIRRLNLYQTINRKYQRITHNKTYNTIRNHCLKNVDVDQRNTRIKTINNCDGPIDSFTGRSTELSDLNSIFNEHNIIVIHGVGGVGKTQLARKFAAVNKNNYNCLFWLQAEFPENLIKDLRQLAIELDIENGMNRNINQIRNEIYDILKTRRALLIFDNILNDADIRQYLPSVTELKNTEIHILITSQFRDWNQKTVKRLPLIALQKRHALELLNKILNTKRENEKNREELVDVLEYMPLAIEIAASYINTQMIQNDNFTITRYIEKLNNGVANIHECKHIEYGKTMSTSIKMSLDIIRETNSCAMDLIYIIAFLNSDSITKEVLLKILKINSEDAKEKFCDELQFIINYSVISSFDNILLHLHRNIQEIIRDELTQLDTDKFLKYYELILDYVLNNEDQNSIRNTYVFKYAKDYTKFILEYYNVSKSAKLIQLLCEHGCLKNVKKIFKSLDINEVNFLIEHHGLLHCATLSSNIETVKIICKYNIDVNIKYEIDKTTSLHIACKHGYADIADFLIEKGADTNMKCENGRIALHYASIGLHHDLVHRLLHICANTVEERDKKNQTPLQLVLNTYKPYEPNDKIVKIARFLVEKGANPNTGSDNSYKVIHIAAHIGNYDFLAYLLNNYKLDLNVKNKHGNTPLFNAVAACIFMPKDRIMKKIKLLIEKGADVGTINNDGCTLLHIAALYCHNKIISYLIQKHNISVDTRDSLGETPLFYTLRANKSKSQDDVMTTVKLLIENGAGVQTITNDGRRLLHVAAQNCHGQIISHLIQEYKISVDTPDSLGRTPLFYAIYANKTISEDDVMAAVKLLIENGANVKTIFKKGCILLHIASARCNIKIISYLIEQHRISVETPDSSGRTPLFYALFADKSIPEHDVMATVKLLIKNGAKVETITNDGCSLLHVAAENCHYKIISHLIQVHKISVDTQDSIGRTPLFCAMLASKSIPEDNVMATVKLLIESGADVETIFKEDCSLLHVASARCNIKIISYLIEQHNISVETPDSSGQTPLFYAMLASKSIPEHDVMATVKLLIKNGAKVETITNDGCSLLHVAAEFCHYKIISYLIQAPNISIDTPNNNGETPLIRAMLASKSIPDDDIMATVKLLIENEANVERINNDGRSLLHFAAENCHYKIISYLIHEHNISVDAPDNNGETPLYRAMLASKSIPEDDVMATVKLLIENGAKIETSNKDGCSLLHVAAEFCHYKIISYLFREYQISVDKPDSSGRTPLFYALFADKSIPEEDVMATVKLLIENGAKVETITNDGCSLLHVAAENCHYKIMSYLIHAHNISVDTPDNDGETPLFCVMRASKSIPTDDVMATVKLLIENGAKIETITNDGYSLLHVAAKNCHYKFVSYLIREHQISVDKPDSSGRTPLFYALFADKSIPEEDVMATVKLLIENGAKIETITNDGCSLLHVAAENCHYKIISYLIHAHNISVDTPDNDGETPLFCSMLASKSIPEADVMATVKLLIKNGAKVETITNDGCTLLHVAAENCHCKIVSYLIREHQISVDKPDSSGRTPLFYALFADKSIPEDDVMATVKLLIKNGANVGTISNDGCSLLHIASQYCHDQIIPYLIKKLNISIDTLDNDGESPLLCALAANKSISESEVMATVKLLIENGANVEMINNDGCNLLHVAAENCRDQIITYLIQEHNISVDTPNNNGESPLFSALLTPTSVSEDDILKTIKVLIEMGARVDILDNKGNSLFHIAADKNLRKIMTYLFNNHKLIPLLHALLASEHEDKVMKMIELLAEKRVHMGTTHTNGTGLLHVAARCGCDKIILHLIQKYDLPVTTIDSLGRSPLFCALKAYKFVPEEDVIETIKLLLAQGSTVEATDNTGCTILHYAALFGRYQALTYLLHNYNINIDTKDEDGDTPLHCALIADESINQETVKKIIKKLLSKGASINLKNNKDQTALDLASPEIKEFILKSYTKASKRRLPEITQQTAKRRKN